MTEAATPESISTSGDGARREPVLLKRFPRQAAVASSPAVTTQLPIQKSNVVVERIRLMAATKEESTTTSGVLSKSVASSSSSAAPIVSNIVTLYKVNGDAFESCDITGGQRIGQVKSQDAESHTGVITIAPALLSIADNYFLGEFSIYHRLRSFSNKSVSLSVTRSSVLMTRRLCVCVLTLIFCAHTFLIFADG